MGDWSKEDLVGLYPHHADAPCAGCGEPIADDDQHGYADYGHIWHSCCWPRVRDERSGSDGA